MRTTILPTIVLLLTLGLPCLDGLARADVLADYLSAFDYQERKDMKISSKELLELLKQGKVQFIDIRFREEYEAWHIGFSRNIPLNELPARLGELDKNTLIVTACPHNDRSNLARLFLATRGYNARYLNDGLLVLADQLRGDKARDFLRELPAAP
ncbi:MAG: sulfurtransferase [Desulfobulbaceae bacterium A2]|nr:MAG: sulfurtransferase [Desulfobulbaceae bacterium A2]